MFRLDEAIHSGLILWRGPVRSSGLGGEGEVSHLYVTTRRTVKLDPTALFQLHNSYISDYLIDFPHFETLICSSHCVFYD